MAWIEPDTRIFILRGVPLDKDFTHTYYPWSNGHVGSATTQFNDFTKPENQGGYRKPDTYCNGVLYSFALSEYSYVRRNRNVVRVKIPSDILNDCNYMVYINDAYREGDGLSATAKYFYCFIDNVDYVNNVTSDIHFTVDPMQTFFFDYTLNSCFVEREHIVSDNRGDNIVPEPIGVGESVSYEQVKLLNLGSEDWFVVFTVTFETGNPLDTADGSFTAGTWNQCRYMIFRVSGTEGDPDYDPYYHVFSPAELNTVVKGELNRIALFNRSNGVVNMYMCPRSLLPNTITTKGFIQSLDEAQMTFGQSSELNITLRPTFGSSFTPNNAKLLTYPYCYFTVDNGQGTNITYKYEFFKDCRTGSISNYDIQFRGYLTNAVKTSVMLVPIGYMVDGNVNTGNYEYAIKLTDMPIGTWATNDLLAKVVQSTLGLAATAATLGTGSMVGSGIANAIGTTVKNIAEYPGRQLANDIDMTWYLSELQHGNNPQKPELRKAEPIDTQALGKDLVKTTAALGLLATATRHTSQIGNGNLGLASSSFDFIAKAWRIDERFARKIDAYFDMYGYQTNEVKVPNRDSRNHWNYVKTTNCTLHAERLPHEYAKQIQSIYNNGITFWKHLSEIGDYSLAYDNRAGQG